MDAISDGPALSRSYTSIGPAASDTSEDDMPPTTINRPWPEHPPPHVGDQAARPSAPILRPDLGLFWDTPVAQAEAAAQPGAATQAAPATWPAPPPFGPPPISNGSEYRNIVICIDGTGNKIGDKNTNVAKTYNVLLKDATQLVFYITGLGTDSKQNLVTRAKNLAFGSGLDKQVCEAYEILVKESRPNDRVYLIGYSRGAWAVRVLAAMLQWPLILRSDQTYLIHPLYDLCTAEKSELNVETVKGIQLPTRFRKAMRERLAGVYFMGVWDSVSSLGGPLRLPIIPSAAAPQEVRIFRQALALDEHRSRFSPEYFQHHGAYGELQQIRKWATLISDYVARADHPGLDTNQVRDLLKDVRSSQRGLNKVLGTHIVSVERSGTRPITVKGRVECWFAGCHSDVGGGGEENGKPSLSNIPFRWMLREAARSGIRLSLEGMTDHLSCVAPEFWNPTFLRAALSKSPADPFHADQAEHIRALFQPGNAPENVDQGHLEGLATVLALWDSYGSHGDGAVSSLDMAAKKNESLKGAYHALEAILVRRRKYSASGNPKKDGLMFHLGRPRQISPGHKCHYSVLRQIEYEDRQAKEMERKKGKRFWMGKNKLPMARGAWDWPTWEAVRDREADDDIMWEF